MSEERIQRLSKFDIQILECVKAKSRTEKNIAKLIGLDSSITSPMITNLIMDGYLETITKRRFYFFFRKFYALTPDGLVALENTTKSSWDGIVREIRNKVSEVIEDARDQSLAFNATWQVASAGYKITKFLLSK